MKYIVLGAGLLGVSTAYVLASRGHEVHVIDRKNESAAETSFANGGQLSYTHAEPWANPGVLPKVLKWMFRKDAPLVFRLRADIEMMRWGLSFLANCTSARAEINSEIMLRIGLYSRKKTNELVAETGISFDHVRKGILHIFTDQKEYEHAIAQSQYQEKLGGHETVLDLASCLAMEPSLSHTGKRLVGGIHAPDDESGDAHEFCLKLSSLAREKLGVQFHFNETVQHIAMDAGRITSVTTDKSTHQADGYILALGSYSPLFSKKLGFRLPIYPMKGYSLSLPANDYCPTVSITDTELKLVYSRLGNTLRVAGTAEFAGYDTSIPPHRIEPLLRATREMFPKADYSKAPATWACLRPSTPNGPPIIGRSPVSNLFLNTGHGTLGWTQAAASAYLLSDIIENRPTEISTAGLTLNG